MLSKIKIMKFVYWLIWKTLARLARPGLWERQRPPVAEMRYFQQPDFLYSYRLKRASRTAFVRLLKAVWRTTWLFNSTGLRSKSHKNNVNLHKNHKKWHHDSLGKHWSTPTRWETKTFRETRSLGAKMLQLYTALICVNTFVQVLGGGIWNSIGSQFHTPFITVPPPGEQVKDFSLFFYNSIT